MRADIRPEDLLQAIFGRNGEAPIPVIACATAGDAFECAIEACRIATQYMTPCMLLTDGYIANGSEPWRLPELDQLQPFPVTFAQPGDGGEDGFLPYRRNEKGARPWALPGTEGLEHRIGGLEKAHLTGNVSYDPENHEFMINARQQKVMGIRESIPTPKLMDAQEGQLLVLGWGSTFGAIADAVETSTAAGHEVGRMHLRHVWPLPKGLDAIFSRFQSILVPELNLGQMARLLRSEYPQHNFISLPKVQGQPFRSSEIAEKIESILKS